MRIGMLRNPKKPGLMSRTVAYVCNHYGLEFFYFNPIDVDVNSKLIKARFLKDGEWIKKTINYPDIIDNDPMLSKKYPDLIKSLKKNSILTTHLIGSKKESFNLMHKSKQFEDILIPYKLVGSFDDIEESLTKYHKVLMKPSVSNKGQDIYVLEKNNENYQVYTDFSKKNHNKIELELFYNNHLCEKLYICQPFIESQTNFGSPFDIRIHIRKNSEGNWKVVKMYPRIGFGKNITSTMTQGGGTIDLNSFLEHQFDKDSKIIKDKLLHLSNNLPVKFQNLYSKPLDALGIDLGITPNGDIWLFEINIYPAQKYFQTEDAEARVEYYKFLGKNM
ncbi:YheC/YheD family protein [Mammaliicoccus sciuri]|uniref:YheC/YheD family protein n=1 Tax=Mammaliicoccus sciuri TaxID=1296 RepID=UPI001FB4708B|nr:YheC/YheD family protein [Mammaliicoccus sciuri]MCJ0965373.1 YheC/YheD family protein [Mammaliicoccus sciuri]